MKNSNKVLFSLVLLTVAMFPEMALAASVDALFKSPLDKILELLTGTVAGMLVALAVVVAGIAYSVNKDDGSGWVMMLVRIAFGGVIMVGGGYIAKWWFA